MFFRESWIIGSIKLEVYHFDTTEGNNKFELFFESIQNLGKNTFENSEDLIEKNLCATNIEEVDLLDGALRDVVIEK